MLEIGSAFWEAASSAPYSHPSAIAIFALALLQVLCAYSVVWSFLANLKPALNPGTYAFVVAPAGVQIPQEQIVASVRETEGLSLVIPLRLAHELALPVDYSAAWITLTVHSDLAAVGLTAAFSSALAQAGISCNVIAGVHHDHLFVPVDQAQQAMAVLTRLQGS